MSYFAKITQDYWKETNNLEKAAREYANSMDRRLLFDKKERSRFIFDLKNGIQQLNEKHKRCKPLHLSHWPSRLSKSDDINIDCERVFRMVIYECKE